MGKQTEDDDDEMYVDLELDDGTVTCSIVAIFSASNGQDYIALLPLDEDGENETVNRLSALFRPDFFDLVSVPVMKRIVFCYNTVGLHVIFP